MSRRHSDFKDTQVYGWDAEPKDERPSEFIPSTGFSSLSGYYSMPPDASVYRRARRNRGGLKLVLATLFMLALGAAAMIGFLHMVKS